MTDPTGNIDFFISYRSVQNDWALWVNWVVRSHGFSTVLMNEFQVGTTWSGNMRVAADDCRRLIPLCSDEYWASGPCKAEFDAYWQRHLANEAARFLLPLEIKACTTPAILKTLIASRIHSSSRDAAYAAIVKVLTGITPVAKGPAFTESEPTFPNAASSAPGAAPAPIVWPASCPTFARDMANRDDEFAFFADTLCGTSTLRATLISADTDHGKTRLVSEFYHYGRTVLGRESCCRVDFKTRGTIENLLDTIASDLGPRIPGLANRNPANLRESLRKTRQPVLFVFDTFERATDDAREFVEKHFLDELENAESIRILLAGQPKAMPDPARTVWRDHARRFNLGSIKDPQPWIAWAARKFPLIPSGVVAAFAVSMEGQPGAIANQLEKLGTYTAAQLAAMGIK